jgi:vancomycin permeability regulator SanA
MKKLKRLLIILCLAGIAGGLCFFAIQLIVVQSTKSYVLDNISDLPESDAIMVLGALVFSDGTPHPILQDRLDYAYEMYRHGKAPVILVSGDHGQTEYDEVNAMREYLEQRGVPREDIFMDHAGFNTYDSMYRAKEIFGVGSLLISTQEFHIGRAVYIARGLGIDAVGYPCEDKERYALRRLRLRESLARVKAVWDVLIKRNPRFLGDAIPVSGGDGTVTAG